MRNNMSEDTTIDRIWLYANTGSVRSRYEKAKKITCASGDELSFLGRLYFTSQEATSLGTLPVI